MWASYRDLVRNVIIPYQWDVMNDRVEGVSKSHAIANFRIAAGREEGEFYGYRFQDSDVAKWLEAVAYSLASGPDAALEALADEVIELIEGAQQPDGYLNTHFTLAHPELRWKNERESHETYVSGHMIEAAVAYYRATGKRRLLEVMMRNADHIDSVFGPEEGKLRGYPGHQELELALVRLYEATGVERYRKLASYFIDERGRKPHFFVEEAAARGEPGDLGPFKERMFEYNQSHLPVREQETATGHAVRAVYMYAAMADLAALNGDEGLAAACRRLWADVTRRQMFITGGIGQQDYWEGFSRDYDLPNASTYNETCASIGLVFWARRMARLEPRGEYYDVAEQALYNGVLSGMSLDGRKYFYVNLLESFPSAIPARRDTDYAAATRQGWFPCACCPPNLARLIASIDDYIYAVDDGGVSVHLYVASETELELGGVRVAVAIDGDYPRSGDVRVRVSPERPARFAVRLRIPGWCGAEWSATVGGRPETLVRDGYLVIEREWSPGDAVELTMPMRPRLMEANPAVAADAGRVAIMRGPVVYCLEEVDNGPRLSDIAVSAEPGLEEGFEPDLLGGVTAVYLNAERGAGDWDDGALYREERPGKKAIRAKAVPYRVWDNRGENEMLVWMRRA